MWRFAQRDLKSRFKGTALGWAWSLLLPLATLLTYSLVFSVIFRVAPPDLGNGQPGFFPVWLWAGLIPWMFFLTGVTAAIPGLLTNGQMLQKVYFPSYAAVLGSVGAILVQSSIELGLLGVTLLLFMNLGWTWLLLPVWAFFFVTFVASVAMVISIMNVYYRDLAHLTNVTMQLLFYLTPVIYRIEFVPESWHGFPLRTLVQLNPMAMYVDVLRSLVYDLRLPDWPIWLGLAAWAAVAAGAALVVYRRHGLDIGEAI